MAELVRGSSVPLFDRLAAGNDQEGSASWLLLPEQLQLSIGRELSRLFNTRSRLGPSEYSQCTGTVVDYGIPDFSSLSPRRADDVELLEAALAQAVGHYEPRLKNVSVKVLAVAGRASAATAQIAGDVMVGLKAQRVSFDLEMAPSSVNS